MDLGFDVGLDFGLGLSASSSLESVPSGDGMSFSSSDSGPVARLVISAEVKSSLQQTQRQHHVRWELGFVTRCDGGYAGGAGAHR